MARTEARIFSTVWDDEDFTRLSPGAQWLYWLLLSQPELSMCGVLTEAVGRWAHLANGVDEHHIRLWLGELDAGRFIVRDAETAEVWIRSFVRRDGVLRAPNYVVGMARSWSAVHSRTIRAGVIEELHREFGEPIADGITERFPKGFPNGLEVRFPTPFLAAIGTPRLTCTNDGLPEPIPDGISHPVHTHAHARARHQVTESPSHLITPSPHPIGPVEQPPAATNPPPASPEARPEEEILADCWNHMARCDLEAQLAIDPSYVKSTPAKVLAAFARTRAERHHADALIELRSQPNLTGQQLAEILDPKCGPDDNGQARADASHQRAQDLTAERDRERADDQARTERADNVLATLPAATIDQYRTTAEAAVPANVPNGIRKRAVLAGMRALALGEPLESTP